MSKVNCQFCGTERSSILSLTAASCSKNPNGKYHSPYEGSEKLKYTCKYCGTERSSILNLTSATCNKNANGHYHVPVL